MQGPAGPHARRPALSTHRRPAVSTTDPDATHLRQRDGVRLGYQDPYVVDWGQARIILAVLVAAAEVPEDHPARDLCWHARFRWRLWPHQATGEKAYGTLDLIRAREDQGVRAYMPLVLARFGRADQEIPPDQGAAFAHEMDAAGVPHEVGTYAGAPHSPFDVRAAEYGGASADAWTRVLGFIATYSLGRNS